jgi:hypothetical protein
VDHVQSKGKSELHRQYQANQMGMWPQHHNLSSFHRLQGSVYDTITRNEIYVIMALDLPYQLKPRQH